MYAEDTIFATILRMRQSLCVCYCVFILHCSDRVCVCVFILHCSDSYGWTESFHWRSCFAMLWLQTYCLLLYVFGCTKQVFGIADRLHTSKLTSINGVFGCTKQVFGIADRLHTSKLTSMNGLNEVQQSSHSSSRQVLYSTAHGWKSSSTRSYLLIVLGGFKTCISHSYPRTERSKKNQCVGKKEIYVKRK